MCPLPVPGANLSLQFELAMFPRAVPASLVSYELYLAASTMSTIFQVVPAEHLQRLRLSGRCRFSESVRLPRLAHLTICSVTSNYLDQHLVEDLSSAQLTTFRYSQGDRMGFEITDHDLSSVTRGSAHSLKELVLLQCRRLTSGELAASLQGLPCLEYLALSFITTTELDTDFVSHIPATLVVLKLRCLSLSTIDRPSDMVRSVTSARYTPRFLRQQASLCDSLETRFLTRGGPLQAIYLCFAHELLQERSEHWQQLADTKKYNLYIKHWEADENL